MTAGGAEGPWRRISPGRRLGEAPKSSNPAFNTLAHARPEEIRRQGPAGGFPEGPQETGSSDSASPTAAAEV